MKYNHPVEIPMSKRLFFDWIGPRIPTATPLVRGDTYPITWADDNGLYSGSGDPWWMMLDGKYYGTNDWRETEEVYRGTSGLVIEKFPDGPEPFNVERVNDMPGFIGGGGCGPKPTGMICVDSKLYFAAQNLLGSKPPRFREKSQHGSDATILCSEDYGKTWNPDLNKLLYDMESEQYERSSNYGIGWKTSPEERVSYQGWEPMFPGNLFGGPSFVQFGKNNADAIDEYIYAVSPDQWDNGRELRLGRVHKEHIMDRAKWEFAIPDDDKGVQWTKDLEGSKPILSIDGHMSLAEMVYIRSIQKFILVTGAFHTDFRTPTGSELTILESGKPWGPFSLVHYEWMWYKREMAGYNPRIPMKWLDQESLEGYLLNSGDWETGAPYYLPQIRKFKFSIRKDNCK